jgi:cystathionine beta-lyase/cystathionine gamma-synthase
MIAFRCAGGAASARAFCDRVALFLNAPSLGGVESLVCLPAVTSHAGLTPQQRQDLGIGDDVVRLSIGLEDPDDLWADLDRALR